MDSADFTKIKTVHFEGHPDKSGWYYDDSAPIFVAKNKIVSFLSVGNSQVDAKVVYHLILSRDTEFYYKCTCDYLDSISRSFR